MKFLVYLCFAFSLSAAVIHYVGQWAAYQVEVVSMRAVP